MDLGEQKPSLESPLIFQESAIESRHGFSKYEIVEEVKKQMMLAGPLVSVSLLNNLVQVISVMFVGHLGELALSGASLATSFASVTGFSLLRGLVSALETFCGQSYGAKQYHMLGIHLQRAMIVLLLAGIILAFIWANTSEILQFLRQDPEISAEAGRYARFMIPSIFGFAIQECHIRFLQSQNNVIAMMICSGITTVLHFFICWILVFKSGLGNKGAAVANCISSYINALLLVYYVWTSPSCKKTWTGFSKNALHGIPNFLKLAIPSTAMISLETLTYEMVVLLSGLLPNPKLETAVLTISLNTSAMTYMIPLGLGGATSTRVSNELGGGKPQAARLAVRVALFIVGTEGILVACILIFGRNVWGYLYSTEERIVKHVGEMLLLVAISYLFDGFQAVLAGTVRGCGRQKIGAIMNLCSYYVIGIPCSILLAFVCHIGGKGLWMGIMVALFVQAVGLSIITLWTDWEKEEKKACERVYSADLPVDASS